MIEELTISEATETNGGIIATAAVCLLAFVGGAALGGAVGAGVCYVVRKVVE
ncbi:hypothetical protein ACT3CD_09300 [Geofilum sp. OHC36d9]|uniref:hypothetical protein n=1 Tax=Geofilum sp. OHC36d9 TaxID=3458413 RepID=UPI004033D9CD